MQRGYTLSEMIEGGRLVAKDLNEGKIPAGTTLQDWEIIGDIAVYKPYIPLYTSDDHFSLSSKSMVP